MSDAGQMFTAKWQETAHRKDVPGLLALLAPDARLISPIVFKPIVDRRYIGGIFAAIMKVLPDFSYSRCEVFPGGALMIFEGSLGDMRLEGLDLFTLNDAGFATELKVFVRPLKAAMEFAARMQAHIAAMPS